MDDNAREINYWSPKLTYLSFLKKCFKKLKDYLQISLLISSEFTRTN